MGKININAKVKKALEKVNRIQPLKVPMKAKAKTEKEQLLSTPISKKFKQSKVLGITRAEKDTLPVQESSEKLLLKTSTEKTKILPKKDKLLLKRNKLLNKFALMKKELQEEAKRKKRASKVVVGDLNPLKDALPSLKELFDLSKKTNELDNSNNIVEKPAKKLTFKKKIKQKKEKMVRQVKSFEALLKDPDFKKNKRDAINFHVKYKYGLIND